MVGLAIGLRMAFGDTIPPLLLVIAGQFFLALPIVFRIVDTVVSDLHPPLIEAARGLGAGAIFLQRTVYFPLLARG